MALSLSCLVLSRSPSCFTPSLSLPPSPFVSSLPPLRHVCFYPSFTLSLLFHFLSPSLSIMLYTLSVSDPCSFRLFPSSPPPCLFLSLLHPLPPLSLSLPLVLS